MITRRDKQIFNLLEEQYFCLYKDITKKFFPSEVAACNRLKKLKDNGWITIEPIRSFYSSRNIDDISLHLLGDNKKIVRLNNKHKILKKKISRWKTKQQLILIALKDRLENFLGQKAVFEHELIVKPTFYNGDYEPFPEFYIQGEGYKLAVEFNLHLKRNSRYHLKMEQYEGSRFTHVLYFITNMRKITSFIRTFQYRRFVGIAHYSNEKQINSYRYGVISLEEWLKKKIKIRHHGK